MDIAGQEKYKSITKIYYPKSDSIIFVYDITDIKSFEAIKLLYEDVKDNIDISKVLVFIVGNKSDKYNIQQVKREDGENYAQSINGEFRLVSALSSYGVNELFENIGKILVGNNRKESTSSNISVKMENRISLKKEDIKDKKKGGGCCK